jgi:single-stranded-DNA-specific exonuclease
MALRAARWIERGALPGAVLALQSELGVSQLTARVLAARGFADAAAANAFLHPRLDDLHDPFLLADMRQAVDRLRRAVAQGEKILLYGDYDVDGTTSVVLLKKTLELAGANVDYHVPHRLRDGYGMRAEVVERAAAEGVGAIVSVDTGIRANEVVRQARELGVDVIVTDHHLPEAELPPATAVLNPNRRDCGYPEKNLCGAGVAFKLAQGLMKELGWAEARTRALTESLLKMVAIATVADVVPLVGENRVIVKHGLAGLREVRNPGLRALLRVAGFREGEALTAGQVAFRVAPRINAAGRMDTAADAVEMFLTSDAARAAALASKLHELNAERQQTEAETLEACLGEEVTDAMAGLVFSGAGWHRGVVGIVASRLVERHSRPVFVLSVDEETGETSGSGRSIESFHLLDCLESMRDLFSKFGGHAHAAGLTLPSNRLGEFRERFQAYAAGRLRAEDFRPTVRIDAEAALSELNDATAAELLGLGPFGYGNPAPVLAARDIQVVDHVVMKEKHLRLRARQNGRAMSLKGWHLASRAGEISAAGRVDVAFTIEDDAYSGERGYAPWSATLRDFRPSGQTDGPARGDRVKPS